MSAEQASYLRPCRIGKRDVHQFNGPHAILGLYALGAGCINDGLSVDDPEHALHSKQAANSGAEKTSPLLVHVDRLREPAQ